MGKPDPRIRDAMLAHLKTHHLSMCRHWFEDIEPLEISGGMLRLLVREPVQLHYLQRRCVAPFQEAAQVATGRLLAIRFIGEADLDEQAELDAPQPATQGPTAASNTVAATPGSAASDAHRLLLEDDMIVNPDYSFENFVSGPGNRLAHAAAIAVAQMPGRAYNPFFIHGGVGLGKTHLLQAICQACLRGSPRMRIYYVSCDSFMNQFLDAVQAGQMSDFRYRFRNVDLLVVDDIHDLSKRDRTQEEFFHTFNCLHQAGKQIVLSSDGAPSEIPSLEERLVSRFNSGLVARIEKPCYETRMAIVKRKASLRNLPISDEIASYVAARIDSNIRELEGAITSIQSLALINNCAVDLELAKQAIGDRSHLPGAGRMPGPTMQTILDAISVFYDLRLPDLLSKRRHKSVTRPRQVGMWLARKYTRYSLEEIGSYFGGRDHTTVMHAIRTIDTRKGKDDSLHRELEKLEHRLTMSGHADAEPAVQEQLAA